MRNFLILVFFHWMASPSLFAAEADFQFGFAKVDITPSVPLRLSGYGSRDKPFEGIDEKLFVRVMAMTPNQPDKVHVLVSVDTIGFPGVLTKEIHEAIQKRHQIPRSRFVICCTHSHTAPHIGRGLSNLFATPLTEDEQKNTDKYTNFVRDQVIEAVTQAIEELAPGKLLMDHGTVEFARNRRVLENGLWTGFGENPNGPVDHSLPVLRITNQTGDQTRGLIFNYACHCTTFGGEHNRVNGDWAGYASQYLEAKHDGAVALCTIGCGADANPERNRDHALEIAQRQGREIEEEVNELLEERFANSISVGPETSFGFAGLPIDRPSKEDLEEALKSSRPQVRRHAEVMADTWRRMGRLPETYPMPIQVWRFGNQFAMVFLGGEVCVEYALRIKKELAEKVEGLSEHHVWVTAYANDVFAYVAPERMRKEGGYEVDFSMIYYLQPGRWSTGTEEVIIRRVHELFDSKSTDVPLSVNEALKTFSLPEGLEIGVVAAEPLIRDPINFVVDENGRLWVVEMGDYPRGNRDADLSSIERHEPWDGPPGGTIKVLVDEDKDGQYDKATVFLDKLSFPTGVFPWRDGVLISGAPDIIFAKDNDGDLRCDETEVLYTGFEEANPQHRVAGFEYGLDGWLYLSAGTNNHVITCLKTGEEVDISGRDCRIHPDSGKLEPVSGRSQYGRCRDEFGNWYGNTNSEPLFQFVIEDRYLQRNPHVASPSPKHHLTKPARAPRVYPTSRTVDRFNDLFALDRFTSACSPTVFRDVTLGPEMQNSVLICEPVHNLVSRVVVDRTGIEFVGKRHPDEQESEFLSSTDNWFRPVRMMTGPDGALWVCDMYRHVIEHPEWIPEAWQAKLDLYAGSDRGRIYRLFNKNQPRQRVVDLSELTNEELVGQLESPNGWRRDTAQRLLIENATGNEEIAAQLTRLIGSEEGNDPLATPNDNVLVQTAWTLSLIHPDGPEKRRLYRSLNPEVVINALRIWGANSNPNLQWQPLAAITQGDRVMFELALALGDAENEIRQLVLGRLALLSSNQLWIRTAVMCSATENPEELLHYVMNQRKTDTEVVGLLLATLMGKDPAAGFRRLMETIESIKQQESRSAILIDALKVLEDSGTSIESVLENANDATAKTLVRMGADAGRLLVSDELKTRTIQQALQIASLLNAADSPDVYAKYLAPQYPHEVATTAIESLLRLGYYSELLSRSRTLTPELQSQFQSMLLTESRGTQALLDGLAAGEVNIGDLTAATRDGLSNHRSRKIRETFQKIAGSQHSTRAERIEQFREALSLTGDAESGRKLFAKTCVACHQHQDLGNDFGPKLATLTQKSDDYILTAIIDPNSAAEAKYRSYTVSTVDGKVSSGLILEETATSIKLVRPDGKPVTVLRRNIDEMVNTGRSFMPEGLEKDLSPQQVADLIAFIRS